jgi:hypothetical protein
MFDIVFDTPAEELRAFISQAIQEDRKSREAELIEKIEKI